MTYRYCQVSFMNSYLGELAQIFVQLGNKKAAVIQQIKLEHDCNLYVEYTLAF